MRRRFARDRENRQISGNLAETFRSFPNAIPRHQTVGPKLDDASEGLNREKNTRDGRARVKEED